MQLSLGLIGCGYNTQLCAAEVSRTNTLRLTAVTDLDTKRATAAVSRCGAAIDRN